MTAASFAESRRGYIMGRIIEYRKSEESRQQILAGLEEYKRQQFQAEYERMQAACRPPLTAVERQRLKPSMIDRAIPYILILGFLAFFLGVGAACEWVIDYVNQSGLTA